MHCRETMQPCNATHFDFFFKACVKLHCRDGSGVVLLCNRVNGSMGARYLLFS